MCSASGKVRFVTRPDQYLPFPVPMEEAINKEEVAAYQTRKAEAQAAQKALLVLLVTSTCIYFGGQHDHIF